MNYELEHRTSKEVKPGLPFPIGATLSSYGVNFAIYSRDADEVYLLLFDADNSEPTDVIQLTERDKFIWHVFVPGLKAGQFYGYKFRGPYRPEEGYRFNERKLLLDPYAKAVTGKFVNSDNLLLAYQPLSPRRDLSMDLRDNISIVPKAIVIDDRFDWQGDTPELVSLEKLIIYEVHMKGFTAHPSSRVAHPGTYLGFIEKIPYLSSLGVNAVEFLPIHEYYVDDDLRSRGLTNYWGYQSLGFFAPESSYSACEKPGCQVDEFKTLVRELHKAGIKAIMDVVYNHSGEGSELGPTMCLRGVDNRSYYHLTGPDDQPGRLYKNFTGCGNALNFDSLAVIRLVMDSLRYWTETMHVDGFRFDLASVLGRDGDGDKFNSVGAFFEAVAQDPVLHRVHLIAEPWDLGAYEVGNFPVDWSEWNGKFRDTVRKFGKGDGGHLRDIGWRLTGSADLYCEDGRSAYNSVNFVTCHDGFTLYDLVSYNEKHNEANGERNEDGANDNNSWNCGAEGPTEDEEILKLRRRLVKNHACMLLFSAGTPMMLGGDEFLRTQRGNNNAYCQDNETSWFDWSMLEKNWEIFAFFQKAIALTRRFPILQRRKFFTGKDLDDDGLPDVSWYGPDMQTPNWDDPEQRCICLLLDGGEEKTGGGDYQLFIVYNCDYRAEAVKIPPPSKSYRWRRLIDTSLPPSEDFKNPGEEVLVLPAESYLVGPRTTVVLLGT